MANKIDMNMQSDLMAAFEGSLQWISARTDWKKIM